MPGTTNVELQLLSEQLKISHFRGVFMRDQILSLSPQEHECGIINLNSADNNTSGHWLAWFKSPKEKIAYSSFGDPIPQELIDYLKPPILTSDIQIQNFGESICGELCILILYLLSNGKKFESIILELSSARQLKQNNLKIV